MGASATLGLLLDGEDLPTLVGAADTTGGVGKLGRLALRAGHRRDGGSLPLCPAVAGVAARCLSLRDRHGSYSSVLS
jgi:hypothetical protein